MIWWILWILIWKRRSMWVGLQCWWTAFKSKVLFIEISIKPLVSDLLNLSLFRKVEILCDIVFMIGNKLPYKWRNFLGEWTIHVCKSSSMKNFRVAKSLVTVAIYLSSPPNDLTLAYDLATELLLTSRWRRSSILVQRSTMTKVSHFQLISTASGFFCLRRTSTKLILMPLLMGAMKTLSMLRRSSKCSPELLYLSHMEWERER